MTPRRLAIAISILLLPGVSASGHRLDEYLQATIISVENERIQASMRLVPGVAVSDFVLKTIDANADGVISQTEQRAYAERVLRDVSLSIDGDILRPRLIWMEFPGIEELKEGLGEIRIEFSADLPRNGPNRRLTFENHHQRGIAAYLINCLAPSGGDITVLAQNRNEQQSFYQLDYVQAGVISSTLLPGWQGERVWFGLAGLLLAARFTSQWRRRPPTRLSRSLHEV
jgi:hypothetical protein